RVPRAATRQHHPRPARRRRLALHPRLHGCRRPHRPPPGPHLDLAPRTSEHQRPTRPRRRPPRRRNTPPPTTVTIRGMTSTDDRAAVAERAAALLDSLLKPRWQPQPHQIPPPGNWTGWLLMAGRGAGKSKACSEYVRQHVNGPPCLPGPVPHWIAIIAPTLGDGVTSMYEGPGGIRNADPGARLVQAPGGTVIRWPNGSQAKLFGAHTPEDVERLRAGGNSCLAVLEEFAAWRYM